MKRRSKILVVVLVLFLIMAVGYAIFTKQLFINGTARANGKLDLTYECEAGFDNGETGTCEVDGNTITTTSTFTKPIEQATYSIRITNTGSIPVAIKTVKSPNNYACDNNDNYVPGDKYFIDMTTLLAGQIRIYTDKCDNGYFCEGNDEIENANITIFPNESLYLDIYHGWLDNEQLDGRGLNIPSQPVIPEEGATMRYNVELGFEQITS